LINLKRCGSIYELIRMMEAAMYCLVTQGCSENTTALLQAAGRRAAAGRLS